MCATELGALALILMPDPKLTPEHAHSTDRDQLFQLMATGVPDDRDHLFRAIATGAIAAGAAGRAWGRWL